MTVCFITYGCKVNQAEAQKWELILRSYGYKITNKKEKADIWIINTCAVTQKAENQSRKIIKRAGELGIEALITGCYVTLTNLTNRNDKLKFFSNHDKNKLLNEFKPLYETNNLTFLRHRGIIKIQDGCDHYCSYCIVPYLRGNPLSIPKEEIIREIKKHEDMGIKEIVLSGINLGLYGKDLKKLNLNNLLKEILEKTKISKIRLSSIEINHIDNEFLEIIGEDRICKHLHIPIQHGSDRILKLMNRAYNTKSFENIFKKIIDLYPKISVGTDIIVGFPSETEKDFENTVNLVKDLNFSYLHVFPYSSRPLTEAAKYKEQLKEDLKKIRTEIMLNLGKELKEKYIRRFIGKEIDVIVESKKSGYFTGTSDNYIKCVLEHENLIPGNLIKILIKKVEDCMAHGTVVN